MVNSFICREVSPNGHFSLEISRPAESMPYFLATFRRLVPTVGLGEMGMYFGPYSAEEQDELVIRWNLPDQVCGIYLGSACYVLFRFGRSRRRARGSFRGASQPFTEDEIAWFCAKTHVQFQSPRKQLPSP